MSYQMILLCSEFHFEWSYFSEQGGKKSSVAMLDSFTSGGS